MQLSDGDSSCQLDPAAAAHLYSLDMQMAARTSLPVLISAPQERALFMAIEIAVGPAGRDCDGVVVVNASDRQYLQSTLARAAAAQPGALRTVVVHDVDALDHAQQSALMPLMADIANAGEGGCRLIATTSVPLFERVQQGSFDSGLFYSLNTIHIKVDDLES